MTVLITGFEPFADYSINPSYEAVRRLPDQICGATVVKRCLPVVFGESADSLRRFVRILLSVPAWPVGGVRSHRNLLRST